MKPDSENKPTQAIHHSKLKVLGYTALLMTIVQVLNVLIRKHPFYEVLIMWFVSMGLAWVLIEVTYQEILKIQTQTTDQLSTTALHGERLSAMIRLISELATTFNEDEICSESVHILNEHMDHLKFKLFTTRGKNGELILRSESPSIKERAFESLQCVLIQTTSQSKR